MLDANVSCGTYMHIHDPCMSVKYLVYMAYMYMPILVGMYISDTYLAIALSHGYSWLFQ